MLKRIKSIFNLTNAQLKKTDAPLQEIKTFMQSVATLSDEQIKERVLAIKSEIKLLVEKIPDDDRLSLKKIDRRVSLPPLEKDIQKALFKVMPEFYAMVAETYNRKVGFTYHDVQLRAGIILAEGQRLVELATGEGKTMTFQLPLFLYALAGRGAHLVTVNDYLSKRDGEYAGHIAAALGLTVGIVTSAANYKFITDSEVKTYKGEEGEAKRKELVIDISKMDSLNLIECSKKEAYNCDITYGTNNEFGFDYLRDNMAWDTKSLSQRELYFCVIDEADSILIDEARTPLIISGMPSDSDTEKYKNFAAAVSNLEEGKDFEIDHKTRAVSLTEDGIVKVENNLGIANLWKDYSSAYHIENALKAKTLFKKDDEYLVRNGEVLIVDEFTGRVLPGRRYSEGLHQAIEAKEGVEIKQESKTYATITFQNYFRLYKVLGGGSGTIMTEAEEFYKIYGLESVPVPTNKPVIRKDYPDVIYKTQNAKFNAVINDVIERHKAGQPVLIGTTSVEKSEIVSQLLDKAGIVHSVLNAKFHEQEAKIIEKAGSRGAVTVATNMAGRGADIVIGGGRRGDEAYNEVLALGGLHVIGTERHEARRIDNQLRGRTGRQGEPGSSRFYVSLEDQLMKILGGEIMQRILSFVGLKEDMPIEAGLISRQIETAQKRIEGMNFDNRKRIVEYDDVMNQHREIFYSRRRRLLTLSDNSTGAFSLDSDNEDKDSKIEKAKSQLRELIVSFISKEVEIILEPNFNAAKLFNKNEFSKTFKELQEVLPVGILAQTLETSATECENILFEKIVKKKEWDAILEYTKDLSAKTTEKKFESFGNELYYVAKVLILQSFDNLWIDHLELMKDIREGIGLQAYAQKDPLVEYKNEAFVIFSSFIRKVNTEVARKILRIEKQQRVTAPAQREIVTNTEDIDDISTGDREFLPAETEVVTGEDSQNSKKLVEKLLAQRKKQESTLSESGEKSAKTQLTDKFKNVGRNDLCPCGSGKKFKKCHGAA